MVEQTQEAGADAVLVVMPYYSRPSQDGIVGHYKAVDESAEKPIIVYDVPGRTGLKVKVETYDRLAELEHVKAVKDATGDLAAAVEKQQRTGLAWYSGDDGLFLPFLSIGAVGIISVIAHVASNPMQQLVQAFDRGDITTARRLANQLAPLVHALNGDGYQAVMARLRSRSRALSPPPPCVCRTSVPTPLSLTRLKRACALPDCCKPETLHTGCQPAAPA